MIKSLGVHSVKDVNKSTLLLYFGCAGGSIPSKSEVRTTMLLTNFGFGSVVEHAGTHKTTENNIWTPSTVRTGTRMPLSIRAVRVLKDRLLLFLTVL